MMEWPELDALSEEMHAGNDERWQETQELRKQFEQLQSRLQVLAEQYAALNVHEALRALNDRLLSGMGTIEMVQSGVGIEYIAALVWPAAFDPRAADGESQRQGLYRIEVWLGPGMQDGQPRIRISGEKRLEAKLPTSTERFRAALLNVFRNPHFVAGGSPQEARDPDDESATASESPAPAPEAEPEAGPDRATADDPLAVPESEQPIPMGPPGETASPA